LSTSADQPEGEAGVSDAEQCGESPRSKRGDERSEGRRDPMAPQRAKRDRARHRQTDREEHRRIEAQRNEADRARACDDEGDALFPVG